MSVGGTSEVALAPWLQRQLRELLPQRGHALLLVGPSGLGQFALAQALAKAWLCEQPGVDGACGQCPSCHAFDVHTHTDLRVLLPDALALEEGWPLDERTLERIEKKEIKPSRQIRVESTREAVAFSQVTQGRAHGKVILVWPAERMNTESANTLLKTLEEPPGALRFVLATSAAAALLPTLRSRCQQHTMRWPEAGEAQTWLSACLSREGRRGEDAALWLDAAGGRPEDALALARSGLSAQAWADLPQALARGDATTLGDWPPARLLDAMHKLCHDLMATTVGAAPRYFRAGSLPPAPELAALTGWQKTLQREARTLEHPYHAGLRLDAWLAAAAQTLALH